MARNRTPTERLRVLTWQFAPAIGLTKLVKRRIDLAIHFEANIVSRALRMIDQKLRPRATFSQPRLDTMMAQDSGMKCSRPVSIY
ncbi:uncharacterized protein SETTUDRAFT_165098 [Exserohilum turcica Et28A]|uniref:Uncharacterized protein n=1 Tax=Exserohilum turcicum (strain 28A) TaxID=671987 RepID=R0IBJ8_EXST2|nr:uncharacterized protein SETTUDRAFT_165098 [Exserohilum turcica Et28A]EOA82616.1 hypothetical protein SETTUDRAFT_165098 [Exserohilum turcica Et28A]